MALCQRTSWLFIILIICSLDRHLHFTTSSHALDLQGIVADQIQTVGGCNIGDPTAFRPNLIFILLDSLGWGDLSVTTGQFPTPNMDALYRNAVRLNRHYVHLMCSASRSQFLTGRYAMNLGFGEFEPWSASEIGGIPMGQPTIANWLSQFGEYTTYGVGQWHLGYANRRLLPLQNGFDHFYGFYIDSIMGKVDGVYDLWSDGEPQYDVIGDLDTDSENGMSSMSSMSLLSRKMTSIFEAEGMKRREAMDSQTRPQPFYLFAALPSSIDSESDSESDSGSDLKSDFQSAADADAENDDDDEYGKQCDALSDAEQRNYCLLLLQSDEVIGEMVESLRVNDLYQDSLIIFTAANGGGLDDGASNYPLRGGRGGVFEGNGRVLATVSGGILERKGLFDAVREDMVSNLDWTPTLLHFAGYLNCIDSKDASWDGIDQYDVIWGKKTDFRDHLVLNIGDDQFQSAAVLMQHDDGVLYKYLSTNPDAPAGQSTDGWLVKDDGTDTVLHCDKWSVVDPETQTLSIMEHDDENEITRFSQSVDDEYLFALSRDEGELVNLLDPLSPEFDGKVNGQITRKITNILEQFVADHDLWSVPMNALHQKMEDGDPLSIEDGLFMRPFLSDKEYKVAVNRMFQSEEKRGHFHSEHQQTLYLNEWQCPDPVDNELVAKRVDIGPKTPDAADLDLSDLDHLDGSGGVHSLKWWVVLIIVGVSVVIMVLIAMTIIMYHCHHEYEVMKRRLCGLLGGNKDAEYQPIKDNIVCIGDVDDDPPSI